MADTPARLLQLLSLLQSGRDWSGAELSERLDVSPRTVRRDVERLRELGYAVNATRGSTGGYRLQAGTVTPPLLLDDDEAIALAIGLRTAAAGTIHGLEETSVRALAKLEQVLPSRLRYRVRALSTATVPLTASNLGPTVDPNVLTAIAVACRTQQRLGFSYLGRDGGETRRLTEPHRLVPAHRRWYLVAWDLNRQDWRTFRVDRIHGPQATGVPSTQRALPAEDAAAYVARALSTWRPRYEATVTLHAPAELVADRLRPPDEQLEAIDENTCRLHTGAEDLDWLAFRLGLLGVDFDVQDPPQLVDHIRALAQRFERAVGGPGACRSGRGDATVKAEQRKAGPSRTGPDLMPP